MYFFLTHGLRTVSAQSLNSTEVVVQSFAQTFWLRDASVITTRNAPAINWTVALMYRQGIPSDAAGLRDLSDVDLVSLAMRAALSGIAPWSRHGDQDLIIVHEQSGVPEVESLIGEIEAPLYLSVMAVMAVTILLQYLQLRDTSKSSGGEMDPGSGKRK